ncbi:MAG: DNA ligase [Candidatus Eisenbacteria bacterium]|nr:DNA ligase [Candidatus Latescibacterota bacterium]MBD3301703.1 DNA ligase [Candidatus Eisenbacteria bacterium]
MAKKSGKEGGGKDTLKRYRSKRDLERSPEPKGGSKRKGRTPRFVIQEHDARSHHFDFRLEVDGVLKSWAIPKGPSTDPREKRLAIAVEDHPLEYAKFEGVIPEGEYGAGTVIVWDAGRYRNVTTEDDEEIPMDRALRKGRVEIWLEGEKLEGGYALIHTKMRGDEKNWILVKVKDEKADARRNPVKSQPKSVRSGRTIAQVAREGGKSGKNGA